MILKALKKITRVGIKWALIPSLIAIVIMYGIKNFTSFGQDVAAIFAFIPPFFIFIMVFRGLILEYDKI